ncbi:hypothetical protein BC831DRAFT_152388 [Entophlyctis helioformis]|nr:hypothetical protein BC831DRAFT_152388 [Entophlyctis helioformis]
MASTRKAHGKAWTHLLGATHTGTAGELAWSLLLVLLVLLVLLGRHGRHRAHAWTLAVLAAGARRIRVVLDLEWRVLWCIARLLRLAVVGLVVLLRLLLLLLLAPREERALGALLAGRLCSTHLLLLRCGCGGGPVFFRKSARIWVSLGACTGGWSARRSSMELRRRPAGPAEATMDGGGPLKLGLPATLPLLLPLLLVGPAGPEPKPAGPWGGAGSGAEPDGPAAAGGAAEWGGGGGLCTVGTATGGTKSVSRRNELRPGRRCCRSCCSRWNAA